MINYLKIFWKEINTRKTLILTWFFENVHIICPVLGSFVGTLVILLIHFYIPWLLIIDVPIVVAVIVWLNYIK